MATISASFAAANQPRLPRGPEPVTVQQTYVTTANLADADVIHLTNMKVPHGATITDIKLISRTVDGGTIFQLGLSGGGLSGQGALFGSATASTVSTVDVITTGLPYRYSASDDQPSRFVVPTLTVNGAPGSATTSTSVTLQLSYTMVKTA